MANSSSVSVERALIKALHSKSSAPLVGMSPIRRPARAVNCVLRREHILLSGWQETHNSAIVTYVHTEIVFSFLAVWFFRGGIMKMERNKRSVCSTLSGVWDEASVNIFGLVRSCTTCEI